MTSLDTKQIQAEHLWDFSLNDEVAFRKMFEYYYASLCIYAKRYVQELEIREDLIQDVFCSLWINRKRIDYSVPISNYLMTSVKNHCLNYLRKVAKQGFNDAADIEKLPVYAEESDHLFLLHELEELFNRALASLRKEYRIAFEMSRMEDKSTTEIAETLGVSVRTVERYRNKAIEILRTELKDYVLLLTVIYSLTH
ncbi:MAG: RNA polymerase sigma-70 factor [Tannerellaceae bacterium]|jgi:RNA polymerase sigma-70 factor (ECF subfamily)|nr:RNA polymerase sigma-70 factor [Tannerellaceae bacterium]